MNLHQFIVHCLITYYFFSAYSRERFGGAIQLRRLHGPLAAPRTHCAAAASGPARVGRLGVGCRPGSVPRRRYAQQYLAATAGPGNLVQIVCYGKILECLLH